MLIERNKIYNEDCINILNDMIEQNIEVDFILTDPPYGIKFVPPRKTFEGIQNDDFSKQETVDLIYEYFKLCYKVLKDDSFMVSFMGWSTIPTFNDAITKAGFTIKSMPVWVKNNFGIGYYTRPQYEPMYLCIKGSPKPPQTAISDVLKADKVVDAVHSCQKPINLLSTLLRTFSKEGDLVFDGFGGSFSTCVACKKCGREFISCELDKDLFKIGEKNLFGEVNQISLFEL